MRTINQLATRNICRVRKEMRRLFRDVPTQVPVLLFQFSPILPLPSSLKIHSFKNSRHSGNCIKGTSMQISRAGSPFPFFEELHVTRGLKNCLWLCNVPSYFLPANTMDTARERLFSPWYDLYGSFTPYSSHWKSQAVWWRLKEWWLESDLGGGNPEGTRNLLSLESSASRGHNRTTFHSRPVEQCFFA